MAGRDYLIFPLCHAHIHFLVKKLLGTLVGRGLIGLGRLDAMPQPRRASVRL
jgi:hypothetical protein